MADPTVNMIMDNFVFGTKVVASHQGMRVLRNIATKVVKSRLGENADTFLASREGIIMVDLATPSVFHALASRGMIPLGENSNQKIAAICDYAFKGSIIRHGLEVTDMFGDVMGEIAGDLQELSNMGAMLIEEATPDFSEMVNETAKEKATVGGGA